MTLEERKALASAYIARCARHRERKVRRRMRRMKQFAQFSTLFAAGVCVIGAVLALV